MPVGEAGALDVASALQAVREWLRQLARPGAAGSAREQAQLLGTAWLAEGDRAVDPDSVSRLLVAAGSEPALSEILMLDPILVGMAARAGQACGTADNWWLAALTQTAEVLAGDAPPLFQAVLEAVGLLSGPAGSPLLSGPVGSPVCLPTMDLLTPEAAHWRQVADAIAAATAFGRRPVEGADLDALRLWLVAALRRYDLQVAAILTRTLIWLDARAVEPVEHALDFLLRQQHPQGWFGHLGPELAGHRLAGDQPALELAVYLPIAQSVCWCLRQSVSELPVF